MKTKRAIVTGANGFLGKHLCEALLAASFDVYALVHKRRDRISDCLPSGRIFETPVSTEMAVDLVSSLEPDHIFHVAAAYGSEGPESLDAMIEANFLLGARLLEAASQMDDKPAFVNASSFFQFSDGKSYSPNTRYAALKQAFEDMLVYYRNRQGLRAVSLVLYDTYGPDDPRPKLWNALLRGDKPQMDLSGGEQQVELVHVDDVVAAFLRAADLLSAGETLQLQYGVYAVKPRSLREIVEQIVSVTGSQVRLNWGALPYRSTEVMVPRRIAPLPGWTPKIDLAEGFKKFA